MRLIDADKITDKEISQYLGVEYASCTEDVKTLINEQPTIADMNEWIPVTERLPEKDKYVLVSFENYTGLDIGRYDEDEEGNAFYPGDDEDPYIRYGLFVNAWMPLPDPYRGGQRR